MKLLLDANLSWHLIKPLQKYFTEILHIKNTNLSYPSSDISIWNYAFENDFYISFPLLSKISISSINLFGADIKLNLL